MKLLGGGVLTACFLAAAVPTPAATAFTLEVTDGAQVVRGIVVDLEGTDYRVGMAAVCDRSARTTTVHLFFGAFPVGLPVQAAVRTAAGRVERFGEPVSTQYGPASGFHAPIITDPADVERFIGSAFSNGALISNGYNSFWNRIPPAENDAARRELLECAGR